MSNGLDDFAGNPEMRIALREPFPPHLISRVTKGSHTEDYINHAAITDRLNAVCPGWTMSEPQWIKDDKGHIAGVVCSMTIGTVTRWEVGDVDRPSSPGDEAKKAMSDWIKRAAMRFGVGIDLWSKEELQKVSADLNSLPGTPSARAGGGATAGISPPQEAHTTPAQHSVAVAVDTAAVIEGSGTDPIAGQEIGEGLTPAGETLPEPIIIPGTDDLAADAQWANLLAAVSGKTKDAVKLIDEANGTNYFTYNNARHGATWAELAKAQALAESKAAV
jgi:hypothetical protein